MNQKPTIVIPEDPKKRAEIIFALEWQLTQDTNEKDREIHKGLRKTESCQVEKKPAEKVGFVLQKGTLIFSIAFYESDRSHLTQDKSCPDVPLALPILGLCVYTLIYAYIRIGCKARNCWVLSARTKG